MVACGEVLLDLFAAGAVKVVEYLRRFEQSAVAAQAVELVLVDEQVVDAVGFVAPFRPRRVGDRETQFRVA